MCGIRLVWHLRIETSVFSIWVRVQNEKKRPKSWIDFMCVLAHLTEWRSCVDFQLSCCNNLLVYLSSFLPNAHSPPQEKRKKNKHNHNIWINEPKEEEKYHAVEKITSSVLFVLRRRTLINSPFQQTNYSTFILNWCEQTERAPLLFVIVEFLEPAQSCTRQKFTANHSMVHRKTDSKSEKL